MPLSSLTDAYGTDIQMTPQGDLQVTPSGGYGTINGPDNCVQALTLRLKSTPGDLPLHPAYGSRFNDGIIGNKADFELLGGAADGELRNIVEADRRFVSAGDVEVVPQPLNTGLGAAIKCTLFLAAGEQVRAADIITPRVTEIVDPAFPDIMPSDTDPLDVQTFDQLEADTLRDQSELAGLQADLINPIGQA